jgi:hypothetical protein
MSKDGTMRTIQCIVTFDADQQEMVGSFVVGRVPALDESRRQVQEAQEAARGTQRSMDELGKMGLCKWETVVELREEDVQARAVTVIAKGSPRRTTFIQNATNTEDVLGITKEDMEDRGDGAAGPSPGKLKVEAILNESCPQSQSTFIAKAVKCMRATILAHFNEAQDPACPSTIISLYEMGSNEAMEKPASS